GQSGQRLLLHDHRHPRRAPGGRPGGAGDRGAQAVEGGRRARPHEPGADQRLLALSLRGVDRDVRAAGQPAQRARELCRHLRLQVNTMAAAPSLEPSSSTGGWQSIVDDWSADRRAFKVPWGKAMMWIFLLSDTFIFSCFLTGYMTVRISTTDT